MRRGGSEFDPQPLARGLASGESGRYIDPELTYDYRQFYGLLFGQIDHTHGLYPLQVGTECICVQHFVVPNAKGQVLLCHGYYDHVGLYGWLIRYLLERGLNVVTFDQLGHGLSSGARVTIESFDHYVVATEAVRQHAQQVLESPNDWLWHWCGQSMGGAVVLETLHQHPPAQLGEVVLLAPLVRPYGWWFARWVFAAAKLTVEHRPRRITQNAENPEFMALQQIDQLQAQILPVSWVQAMVDWFKRFERYPISDLAPKVIQGYADRTVSYRHNIKLLCKRYPGAQVLKLSDARHHLVNESPTIRQQMWDWLDRVCKW